MKPAPEQFRLTPEVARRLRLSEVIASDATYGNNGMFLVPCGREILRCMISDGTGSREMGLPLWEHVSVSLSNRVPSYAELCFVKDLFWSDDETVMQLHVPRCDHVNNHPFCLHLWRPIGQEIPRPPAEFVGLKGVTLR